LKGKIIETRLSKQKDLISTYDASIEFAERERLDAEKLQEQRNELVELNAELRKAYNITRAEAIEQARLSAYEESDSALRDFRHEEVLRMLKQALGDS
jgi:hypothetical protein